LFISLPSFVLVNSNMFPVTRSLFQLLWLATSGSAVPTVDTSQACKDIQTGLARAVTYPRDKAYVTERANYWSQDLKDLTPACIVLPETAEAVSTVVKTLNKYPSVKFAVKSGGHVRMWTMLAFKTGYS